MFKTIDGRVYLPCGIEISVNPRGVVLWCSDWVALFAAAYAGRDGLRVESGGPSTYGDVQVICGGGL